MTIHWRCWLEHCWHFEEAPMQQYGVNGRRCRVTVLGRTYLKTCCHCGTQKRGRVSYER